MKKHQLLLIVPLLIAPCDGFSSPAKAKYTKRSKDDVSSRIMKLSRSGRIEDAVNLCYDAFSSNNDKIKSEINTRMMNNAIGACARSYKPLYNEAFDIFQTGLDYGLTPNVYTFGSLMSVCARTGDVKKCSSLLNQMKKEYGISPNSVIYSTAISSCERCSPPRSDLAIQWLKDGMKGSISTDSIQTDGFINIVAYNAAISVCARAGDWKRACQILNEMEQRNEEEIDFDQPILFTGDIDREAVFIPKPDEVTYGTVMAACERAKEWYRVLGLAKQMETNRTDLELDGMAISSALHACQQLGYGHDALKYLEMMKHLDEKDFGRNRDNRRRKALKGPDDVAFRLAISACARGGLIKESIGLIRQMEKETGMAPDVAAYTAVISGCAETGDFVKACEILKEMNSTGVEPNVITYSAVITACAIASANAQKSSSEDDSLDEQEAKYRIERPMKTALKILNHMKKQNNPLSEPNIVTYNAAIRACAEGQNFLKAFDLLDDLLDRNLEPTIVTYGSLMTACERVGDIEGASKVFRTMRENNVEPNEIIYGAAISCCRKAGQQERSLPLLRKMIENNLSPNVATYNTVLKALAEAKNLDKIGAVYNLLTSNHSKAQPNRRTYNIIVITMALYGEPARAEHYLRLMKENGMKPDVELLTAVVTSYERAKEPIKALKLMESMREEGYDFYQMKIFDTAFKQGVKVISNVAKGLAGDNSTITFSDSYDDDILYGEDPDPTYQ